MKNTLRKPNELPVVAAIPNFNMGLELQRLLPSLDDAGYKEIFILDDASTDNSSAIVAALPKMKTPVRFITGETNIGAGGNRNRIMTALTYDALIHFLDADMVLETPNVAAIIKHATPDELFAFLGGLAKTPKGKQWIWNYGPVFGEFKPASALLLTGIDASSAISPGLSKSLRRIAKKSLQSRPDPNSPQVAKQVGWVVEQNMVVDSRVFTQLGGFDASLREHEIQEFALRARKQGLYGYFDPSFSAQHRNIKVRHYNRLLAQEKARKKILKQFKII